MTSHDSPHIVKVYETHVCMSARLSETDGWMTTTTEAGDDVRSSIDLGSTGTRDRRSISTSDRSIDDRGGTGARERGTGRRLNSFRFDSFHSSVSPSLRVSARAKGATATTMASTRSIASFFPRAKADGDDGGGRTTEAGTGTRARKRAKTTDDADAAATRRDEEEEEEETATMKREETVCAVDLTTTTTTTVSSTSRDAETKPKREVHSFFRSFERRRERAAENRAKGTSTSGAETQGEFVRVRPAPIEEAMGPVHVGYESTGEEARARARARRDDDDDARRGVFERAAPKGSFAWMSVERCDDCERGRRGETASTRPTTTNEEEEDAYADAVAREAKRMDVELDGAMPVNEDELARARGVLRNALVGLKERDDRAPGAQWIDRFKPLRGSDVAGRNGVVVDALRRWLGEWMRRVELQNAGKTPPSPSRPCVPRKAYDSDDDEYWESDEDEDDGLGGGKSVANGVLISGPVGCGKTATVYALAREFGFKVIEVNAMDKRNGQDILSRFMEATQSKRFNKQKAKESKPTEPKDPGLKAFFAVKDAGKTKASKIDDGDDDDASNAQSLLLFEEIDIQLASERGFMAALSQIVENTKRPVVFTSNTSILPDLSVNLPMARVRFDAPSVQECAAYGALASAAARAPLRPSDVAAVSLACKGDLRRTLHNAQLASCTDGIVTTDSIDQDRHPTVLVDAARSLVGAAKALHASLVEQQREEFERTIKCVREGLVRHRAREARWAKMKEAKRAERLKAKKKLLGYDADKAPLDLKDSTVKRATEDVEEETKEQEFEERARVALSAFEPRPPVPEPDWDDFDARPPAGGWTRAREELDALASLARSMSDVDILRSSVCVGVTGPCRRDVPWSKETIGDARAVEDCSPAEDFYLSNGPPRETLGGADNVGVLASHHLVTHFSRQCARERETRARANPEPIAASPPRAPATPVKASRRARGSTRAPLDVPTGAMHPTWRARALAECTGAIGVHGTATTDRLGYVSKMIRLQCAPKPPSSPNSRESRRRTRHRRQHLLLTHETRTDLLDVSTFGGGDRCDIDRLIH